MKQFILVFSLLFIIAGARAEEDLSKEIRRQLNAGDEASLYYPKSVNRFYKHAGYNPAWIKPQSGTGPVRQAMLLLDCVLQYGLAYDDYHPKELQSIQLPNLLDTSKNVKIQDRARFDILLTDAMITLMNNLHYGKLNPGLSTKNIDAEINNDFHAEAALALAVQQRNSNDFLQIIENAQPRSKAYTDLQHHMRLLTGMYISDCYKIPRIDTRLIAINMERLRWANIQGSNYIQINIPDYTLQLFQPNTVHTFRVAVGKTTHPTPAFNSAVQYFTTAPDGIILQSIFKNQILPNAMQDLNYLNNNHLAIYNKKGEFIAVNKRVLIQISRHPGDFHARHASGCNTALGRLVFHFDNPFKIKLHEMPKKEFFSRKDRALSSGCIWVEDAEKLAGLLLKNEGRTHELARLHKAIVRYERMTFILQKPVTIKVTYLTCAIKEGKLVKYNDVYDQDKDLEMALYNKKQDLAKR